MPTNQTRRRSPEPRRRILAAAADVFAERGFTAAGVDEIARRANVNKAMLYYHVGAKATLFREVVLEVVGRIKEELARAVAASTEPDRRLAAVPMVFARIAAERPYFPQIMLREVAAGGVHLPNEMLVEITGIMGFTRQVLDEGRRRGAFRGVNPLLVHLILVGSLLFIANSMRLRSRIEALRPLPPGAEIDLAAAARGVAKIVLNGVAKTKNAGGRR
jgi:TetR/AcrR family transcriptional regulator